MTTHLKVPFALDVRGSARTVTQDTPADVTQCVAVLAGTRPGERLVVPQYGIDDLSFSTFGEVDDATVADAVAEWEPRAGISIAREGVAAAARIRLSVEVS